MNHHGVLTIHSAGQRGGITVVVGLLTFQVDVADYELCRQSFIQLALHKPYSLTNVTRICAWNFRVSR